MNRFVLTACSLLALGGCAQPDWTAFVYPDINEIPSTDQVQHFTIGNYRSFEECQVAAIERSRHNYSQTGIQGDYQCGFDCSARKDVGGLFMCKETRK